MSRIKIIGVVIACMFLYLLFGLLNLEVAQGAKLRMLSRKNCIRLFPQKGARGKILDRYGSVIADNKLSYNVMVLPQEEEEVERVLSKISGILGISLKDIKREFKKNFLSSSVPVLVAKNIEIKKAIALEEIKSELAGLTIQPQPMRSYPNARAAANLIGYVNEIDTWRLMRLADYGYKTKDLVGYSGLEEKYDYYLREKEGGLSIEVNNTGKFVRVLGFMPPRNGKDLQLTIDLRMQKIVQDALTDRKGAIVLMDPQTGEVFALASSPSFDPSYFVEKSGPNITGLMNDPDSPMINRAISGVYPPGSVFKVVVAAAGLETKKINSRTNYLCQGSTFVGRQRFGCWATHGDEDLVSAIAHSCNVFFYKTGVALGGQAIHDYALKFGLSKPVSQELLYEAGGFVPSPLRRKINKFKNWFDGDSANSSIGQGELLVTPLQMARVMAVFANKGYLVTPYVVRAIEGKSISSYQKKASRISLKENTIEYIRQGLRKVVSEPLGTASILSDLPVSVAGKTGTAQAPPGQTHAWFVGFFPFKDPKYVICVFLERGGPGFASSLLAKQIIEEMLNQGLI